MSSRPATQAALAWGRRWWIYQRERFPLAGHGALIAAFSFCAVSLSAMLRGAEGLPSWRAMVVAFVTCLGIFLQLRIADEFKDYEEDARWRPYRPVQRGLVTLRELAWVFAAAGAVQLALAVWLEVRLLVVLGVTWTYLALMSREFFVGAWLRPRAVLYMLSHMLIMPLVDLYATSTDWLVEAGRPPAGIVWFLAASYFNGLVIEMGRKIRSPQDEEEGVATYSWLWGRRRAVMSWWGAMATTGVLAMVVAERLGRMGLIGGVLGMALAGGALAGGLCLLRPEPGRGKWIENYSGVWTLALYLGLGALPHVVGAG